MNRIRVKICGITRPNDAVVAAELGADAIGLVFHAASSRAVDIPTARAVMAVLPPFVSTVGLFLNPDPQQVAAVLAELPLDVLQFHGQESPEFCADFRRPYIKAVPMAEADQAQVQRYAQQFSAAQGLLLDSHRGGGLGGLGKRFDWSRIPTDLQQPVILAGGLNPNNVPEAVVYHPHAVDVSSGIESAPGIKDHQLMHDFMAALEAEQSTAGALP